MKGTPQGGVLSPILWNLAFDEVLSLVEGSAIKAFGYADDLALVGQGPDLPTIISQLQTVLDRVTAWGNTQGLKFSPSKSMAVAFTRKTSPVKAELKLNGTLLPWSRTVKYLGVVLDSRLTWVPHFNEKTKNAKKLLFKYKQIVGTTFGPQPKFMRWMYLGIVRPALLYGAVVWWRCVANNLGRLQTLTKINRLALLTFSSIRRSSPTIALEAMGYVPPLDLVLEGEVIKTWLRIRHTRPTDVWDGIGRGPNRGHRLDLNKLLTTYKIPDFVPDDIPTYNKWSRLYRINTDFLNGTPFQAPTLCFTAGARKGVRAGAGLCIQINDTLVDRAAVPLGRASTLFQAEILAIMTAAEMLLNYPSTDQIIIHSTSQAAITALASPVFHSKTVLATSMALDRLAHTSSKQLVVAWAKPTSKAKGIVLTAHLAQYATTQIPQEAEPVIPTPKCFVKRHINTELARRWNSRWMSASIGRQSRIFWPSIDEARSKLLLRSDRDEYGLFTRLFTGHNNLNRHRSLTGETDDDTCRLCLEAEESSEHILCNCIDIAVGRQRAIGHSFLAEPRQLAQVPLDGISRLISLIRLRLTEEGLEKN